MTYDELLELALKRQRERDLWQEVAMGWKEMAMKRGKLIQEYAEFIEKTLDPAVND